MFSTQNGLPLCYSFFVTLGQWCPLSRFAEVMGDRWSLLILRELAGGPQRFKSLKGHISGISMDQLSRKLDALCASFLIVRQEFSESPPRVEYQLTEKGRTLLPVIRKVIVWSSENLWGSLSQTEELDISVTLRTMASFFGSGSGSALIRIFFSRGGEYYLVERFEDGRVKVLSSDEELPEATNIDVTLEITVEEWIRIISLAPTKQRIHAQGHIIGNKTLLTKILPVLAKVIWGEGQRAVSTFDNNQNEPCLNETRIQTAIPARMR